MLSCVSLKGQSVDVIVSDSGGSAEHIEGFRSEAVDVGANRVLLLDAGLNENDRSLMAGREHGAGQSVGVVLAGSKADVAAAEELGVRKIDGRHGLIAVCAAETGHIVDVFALVGILAVYTALYSFFCFVRKSIFSQV